MCDDLGQRSGVNYPETNKLCSVSKCYDLLDDLISKRMSAPSFNDWFKFSFSRTLLLYFYRS
jgi:hypothetical protein